MSVVVCYACVHSNAVSDNVVYVLFLREHSSMTCSVIGAAHCVL